MNDNFTFCMDISGIIKVKKCPSLTDSLHLDLQVIDPFHGVKQEL